MQITKKAKQTQDFAELLKTVDSGQFNADISKEFDELKDHLNEVAEACNGSAKGSLSITFNVHLDVRGVMRMHFKVNTKKPKLVQEATLWMGEDGHMVTEHPRQGTLPAVDLGRPNIVPLDPSKRGTN